jgi:hypothetical protein
MAAIKPPSVDAGGFVPLDEVKPPSYLIQDSLASGGGILCVGLPRTGTLSLATSLDMLGYKYVHHVMKYAKLSDQWAKLEECAKAHFPYLNANGVTKPYTKEQWDAWLGQFQATTDVTPFFAKELIQTYPKAKVILVVRPYDRWVKSLDNTLFYFVFDWVYVIDSFVDWLSGHHSTIGLKAMIQGWFQADSTAQANANARRLYDEHHAMIRRIVPPENLLEYNLSDGWGPLCEFLDKPVPKEPYPRVNEGEWLKNARAYTRVIKGIGGFLKVATKLSPLIFMAVGYKATTYFQSPAGQDMINSFTSNVTAVTS